MFVGVVLFLVCLSVSVFSGLVSVLAGGYVWLFCTGGYSLSQGRVWLAAPVAGGLVAPSLPPVDTALKPVRACATVVSGGYSAWRVPALWIPAYAGMTVGFAKVSIKGEGYMVGVVLLSPHPVDTALKPV